MRKICSLAAKKKTDIVVLSLLLILISLLSAVLADPITSTQADGLVAYSELNINSPRYRLWNESNMLSDELTDANLTSGDSKWVVTRANHERDEVMVGTQNDQNDVYVNVYGPGGKWTNIQVMSTAVDNVARRGFDIAYEDISGDALILYENSSVATNAAVAYRIWNGTGYSAEALFTTGLANSPVQWVALVPKRGTDDIMALVHNNLKELYAVPWNGTAFDSSREQILSEGTFYNEKQHFAFAWEESSGAGLVGYGEKFNFTYRTYSPTAPFWSTEAKIALGNDDLGALRMCSDPNSDYIGIIWQDDGNDVQARVWDGTQILSSPPSAEDTTEPSGTNNANVDCAWHNSGNIALFGFVDLNALSMDYFNFTKATNAWSTPNLTSTNNTGNFATDNIRGLRFTEHPLTDEIMIVAMDIVADISIIRWNGSAFATIAASPIENNTEVLTGANEAVMFDWYRYDPMPNVRNLTPAGGSLHNYSDTVNITANVTDNIAVDTVLANVTLPNGTARLLTMSDTDGDTIYNVTFTETSAIGNFTVVIIANDTSIHRSINGTQTVTFTVQDLILPAVFGLVPAADTHYNMSEVIVIGANVTDNNAVNASFANLTYPNGTSQQLSLTAYNSIYNASFTIPWLAGQYNITFFANDSSNNINSTETTYFIADDIMPPEVSSIQPTNVNEDTAANYNATVADNVALSSCSLYIDNINNGSMNISGGVANRTVIFSTPGTYSLVANCSDASGNFNDTSTTTVTVNDTTPPAYSNAFNWTPTTYNSSQLMYLNITWIDNLDIDTVTITTSSAAVETVYTASNATNATHWNLTLPCFAMGAHYWKSFANDTTSNSNTTPTSPWYSFTIAKATPVMSLTLNGSSANVTLEGGSSIWLNGSLTTGDGGATLTLFLGGVQQNSGTSVANLTQFSSLGNFNISLNYTSTENYTAGMVSYFVTVGDTIAPGVSNLLPSAGTQYLTNGTATLSADVTDAVNVSAVWANVTWQNGSEIITLSAGTSPSYNGTFTNLSVAGIYNVTFFANDTSANLNNTETTWFNVSDVPDTTPPSWATASSHPASPANYSETSTSRFNVTWTDRSSLGTVLIEHNFTGTLQNYTVTTHADAIYYYTYGPAVGTYVWRMYANDSAGNANVTDQYAYNVTRAAPTLAITNNTAGNTTYGSATNVTCAASSGQVTPVLYRNGTQITNGEAVILAVGTWLFTCNSSQTANYTDATAASLNITLAKATPTLNLTLNGTAGAVTIDEDSPIWLNGTIITGDSSANLTLWRGTTFIAWNQGSIANLSTFETPGTFNISLNYTASENYTSAIVSHIVTVNDITPPAYSNAFNGTPAAFNTSGQLHFNLTWADWNMSSAWLQVNRSGAILNYTMSNVSAMVWNLTIASDFPAGTHYWRSNATDGAGNLNITGWYAFTIPKAAPVLNLTLNGTAGAVTIDEGSSIWLNGSIVSGDADVANLTLYLDTTFKAWNMTWIGNLTTFSAPGIYNVSLNYTPTENYTAGMTSYLVTVRDTTPPSLVLNAPADRFNTTSQTVQFNFTATDTFYTSLNCSLVLDSVTNYTNATTQNGTATVLSIASLAEGQHYWNVTCTDTAGNSNVSATRQFTVDRSAPGFVSITTDPSTADDLDPNLNITVMGNVTENATEVNVVILQYRLSTTSTYTNLTMSLNSTIGFYQTTFNATSAGLYFMRLIANDTVGNSATSNLANITVAYDYTWTITPTTFETVSADPDEKVPLGNLTVNNTGDYMLNFSISSDSNYTLFNESANFSLAAKGVKTLEVNDSATALPSKTVTLTINATPNGDPSSRTATGVIVVAPGQPILVTTFTTPAAETQTVTQGNKGIGFVAKLQNIGNATAYNVTFSLSVPADWEVTYDPTDSLSMSFDEFYSGDEEELNIEVDIPSNATSGTRYVVANTTGVNGSSANLTSLGLTFADVVTVTVNELVTLGALDEEEETPVQQASGGGYPPATLAGIFEKVLTGEELLYSAETFELVRGYDDSFPVVVKNIFDTTTLYNVTLRVEGYLSQYITVSPRVLDKMAYGQSKSFNISIISPDYMEKGTYDLTVIITGKMLGTGIRKDFIEKRKVTLVIHTVGEDEASGYIEETLADIGALEAEGITSARLSALLAEAEKGLAAHDYDGVKSIAETVKEIKETALVTNGLIRGVKDKMGLYKETLGFLLQTSPGAFSETQALLNLATAAFERGDYETALQRMGDAQLALALERSDYATLFFFVDHWLTLLLVTVIVCLEGAWGYKRYVMLTITRRILNLDAEEDTLLGLMRTAQEAYFTKKSIGPDSFHRTMDQYHQRLSKVKQLRSQLRHKRVHFLGPQRLLHDLELEMADITGRLKALQKQYFVTRNISKKEYDEQSKVYNERIAEIEDEQWSIEF